MSAILDNLSSPQIQSRSNRRHNVTRPSSDCYAFPATNCLSTYCKIPGNVTIFRENGKALVSEGTISLPHAHTVSVDPETHLVYFPLQNIEGYPLLRIMVPSQTR